jgi:predicted dehydrogenase
MVGVGQRAGEFIDTMLADYQGQAELVALCDSSMAALEMRAAPYRANGAQFSLYAADDFDRMITEAKPDEVLVLTPDHTHDEYICRAMTQGCDVIAEKPLVTSVEKLQRVIDAQNTTGRNCRVTFNYRYAPWNTAIKEAIMTGVLGTIASVTRRHSFGQTRGAEFFHRWHGQMERSGGMLVHKSTHYLDLINFWLASVPKTVYARGKRNVFTEKTAKDMGILDPGDRCGKCASTDTCPFYRDYRTQGEDMEAVEARGKTTGYYRDECVFRPDVDVPDTNHVMVEYENGAILNYSLCVFGDRSSDELLIGTHGMLHTTAAKPRVTPYFGKPYDLDPPHIPGGHGGGDPEMYRWLLGINPPDDPCKRQANIFDGAWSILIGLAAYRSMETGEAVTLRDMVTGLQVPDYAQNQQIPVGFETAQMRQWVDNKKKGFAKRKVEGMLTLEDTFDPQR